MKHCISEHDALACLPVEKPTCKYLSSVPSKRKNEKI